MLCTCSPIPTTCNGSAHEPGVESFFSIYICAPMFQRGHLKTDRAHQQSLTLKGSYAQTLQNFHHQSVFLTIFRTFLNRLKLVRGLVWREEYPGRSEQTNRKHGARTESLGPLKAYEYWIIYIYIVGLDKKAHTYMIGLSANRKLTFSNILKVSHVPLILNAEILGTGFHSCNLRTCSGGLFDSVLALVDKPWRHKKRYHMYIYIYTCD